MADTYVMGDAHGFLDVVRGHLRDAGLIDAADGWSGGDATLVWIGDLVDRGPDGIGVLDLVRRLEREAAAAGGTSVMVLGNHDLLLLGAARYPDATLRNGEQFAEHHDQSGGSRAERDALGNERAEWLARRPVLFRAERTLFLHADVPGNLGWGRSVAEANHTVTTVLQSGGAVAYDRLTEAMGSHHAFEGAAGARLLERYAARFDVDRIVHGHTPLQKFGDARPTRPRLTQGGRVVNVDGGIYKGGPGFLWRMGPAA